MPSRIVPSGLVALTVFAPIAVGCVYVATYSAMELLIFSLLLVHLWSADFAAPRRRRTSGDPKNPHSETPVCPDASPVAPGYLGRTFWLMSPLFLFLLFCLAQMTPLPPTLLARLSPHAAATYARLGLPLQHGLFGAAGFPLALSVSAAGASLLKWTACASVFILASTFAPSVSDRAGWIEIICVSLVAIGFSEAVYGLYQYVNQSNHILWFTKTYYRNCVTGTYVNRNHFAGLINLCIPVSAGLFSFHAGSRREAPRSRAAFAAGVLSARSVSLYFLFLAMSVMVLGLIFSMSRMGQLSLITGGVFLAMLYLADAFTRKTNRGRTMLLVLAVILSLGALWGVWKGLGPVEDRWQTIGSSYEERSLIWQGTGRLWRDFRLTGCGAGAYGLAYPPYKPARYGAILVEHAHNDYLELLSEVGVIGFVPWLSFFLLFFALGIRAWLRRRNACARFLGAGGLVAAFVFLVHSLADFNLQIPANAVLLFLIMGLTWRVVHTSFAERTAGMRVTKRQPKRKLRLLGTLCGLLPVCVFAASGMAGQMTLPELPRLPVLSNQYDTSGKCADAPEAAPDAEGLDAGAIPAGARGTPDEGAQAVKAHGSKGYYREKAEDMGIVVLDTDAGQGGAGQGAEGSPGAPPAAASGLGADYRAVGNETLGRGAGSRDRGRRLEGQALAPSGADVGSAPGYWSDHAGQIGFGYDDLRGIQGNTGR